MVGGVNDSRRASLFPRRHPLGRRSGIPREPISHTPKTRRSGTRFAAKPGLNGTPLHPEGPTLPDRPTLPHVCAAGHAFRGGGRRGRRGRRYFSRRGRRRDRRAGRSRQPAEVASGPAQREARGWREGSRLHAREGEHPFADLGREAEADGGPQAGCARLSAGAPAPAAAFRPADRGARGSPDGCGTRRGEGRRAGSADRRQPPASPARPLSMPRTGYRPLR